MKTGFIYIWYDRKNKKYYLGCHWGTEDDGYICSSNSMREAYRRRPQDFKRRIIKRNIEKCDLLSEEHKWLALISESELGKKYYNLYTSNTSLRLAWAANKGRKHSDNEKIKRANSNRGKKRTEETKQKISDALTGTIRGPLSDEHKMKVSESLKGDKNPFFGKQHDPELKKQMSVKTSATMKGRPPNNAAYIKGSFWWTNGSINKRSKECPGSSWTRGTIRR